MSTFLSDVSFNCVCTFVACIHACYTALYRNLEHLYLIPYYIGTHIDTSNEPGHGFLNMGSNEAYVVSGDVPGQTEGTENNEYCTLPEQTSDNEYDYVDNNL